MKKRSRFFVANIVLGIIFIIELAIVLAIVFVGKAAFDEFEHYGVATGQYDRDAYELLSVENASVQLLGSKYRGQQAEDGYQYYTVKVMVRNTGTLSAIADYIDIYCEGKEYDDIYMEYDYSEKEDDFSYSNLELIPSCQTAEVTVVAQIKNGVKDFSLKLCRNMDAEEYQTVDVYLE